jgi:hypothetical protein
MVDGGTDYLRRSLNTEPATDVSVYSDDPHEKIREGFKWGSRGKTGAGELVWIFLKDLYAEHINAILDTQTGLAEHIREIFKNELTYRKAILNEKDNQPESQDDHAG